MTSPSPVERPRVLVISVPDWITESDLTPLRQCASVNYLDTPGLSEDEIANLASEYDYVMLNYDVCPVLTPQFYAHPGVAQLRALSCDITGMDWASAHAANAAGVPLLQVPNYSTVAVAESILTEALLHAHSRHAAYQDELAGVTPTDREGRSIASSTVGVIGLGDIGQRTAQLFSAIGATVLCWSRTHRPGYDYVQLDELFSRCDVIAVCTKTVTSGPDANIGFINASLLERARNAIVVNLARPELVDNAAMREALQAGRVVGYSIDGPTGDQELEADPRVHVSPHDAWFTKDSMDELRRVWVQNTVSHIHGSPQNVYED